MVQYRKPTIIAERVILMKRTAFSPHGNFYIQYLKTEQKHDMPVQHYHDIYELYLQLDGTRYLFYDDICYTLERGDLAVFRPFDIHYAESREAGSYARYVINFRDELLLPLLDSAEKKLLLEKLGSGVIHLPEEQTLRAEQFFRETERYSKERGFLSEKLMLCELIQLLGFIIDFSGGRTAEGNSIAPQIMTAIRYIGEHYREELSLDDICSAASTSKYHFSRMFSAATGATVIEYLNNIRLTKAHSLIIGTKYSLDEIARETGFGTAVNLNRAFKRVYGMPPREFRKRNI